MVRYYCEYCHSYLTHDTLSVRKSHLVGKNHLRAVSDYYRNRCRGLLQRKRSKLEKVHRKELRKTRINVLSRVYSGSPGYSKVFIPENRLDMRDAVKTSRLPQRDAKKRKEEADEAEVGRDELFRYSEERILLRPEVLVEKTNEKKK